MSKMKKLASMLLALVMVVAMSVTAFTDTPVIAAESGTNGSITITNATIDEEYHVYKLFDVTYGSSYTDSDGNTVTPTVYIATADQKTALEAADDNVFEFTALSDGTYQVTVKSDVSDAEVVSFVKSYIRTVGSSTVCYFPGAVDEASTTASASTVKFSNLPMGYYFVTSSLGSVVSLTTTNPDAEIEDKNTGEPDWDNTPDEPVPDDPVKDVVNPTTQQSINEEPVSVGDTLEYQISYTNRAGETLSEVVVTDVAPEGTEYVSSSISLQILDSSLNAMTLKEGIPADEADIDSNTIYYELDDTDSDNLTWTILNVPDGATLIASFQVTVLESALQIEDKTVVNDADLTVKLGENKYDLKTNTVENPVEEDGEPVKDVKDDKYDPTDENTQGSIDGSTVAVGDVLTYTITYTNTDADAVDLTIVDTPPTGTVYVTNSAASTLESKTDITVDSDDNITWKITDLEAGQTVTVYFQVEVTEAALSIIDDTVKNSADYSFDEKNFYKTNTVKNPVEDDEPEKDVKTEDYDPDDATTQGSIDGNKVVVDQVLTYTITYTNTDTDSVDLTIKDAPPAGTVYVDGSAESTLDSKTVITVDADDNITWEVTGLEPNETVTVYFQVTVTDEALTLTNSTITNSAEYSFNGKNYYETNTVKNPTNEPGGPQDFGKVIVEADGTETKVSTGAFGDTVKFDVSIDAVNQVANDAGTDSDGDGNADPVQVSAYYIYDKMDCGFTLDADSFVITIDGKEYDVIQGSTSDIGVTTYTIDAKVSGTLFTYVDKDGYTVIEARIPWVGRDADNGYYALYPNCEIHLTYTATINTAAEIAGSGNVNRAIYDYSTVDDGDPYEPDPSNPTYPDGSDLNHYTTEQKTVTYTYALGIQKISAETGEALAGAEFSAEDAGGNPIYAEAVTDSEGNVLYYNYTTDSSAESTFTTNADGQIIIIGVNVGTYTFTEGKAPNGYVLLTSPVSVTATMNSSTTTYTSTTVSTTRYFEAVTEVEWSAYTGDVYTKDADGNFSIATKPDSYAEGYYKLVSEKTDDAVEETTYATYTFNVAVTGCVVENAAGSTLPSTGGIGTTIFYVVGTILVLAAAVLLITRRRMRRAE